VRPLKYSSGMMRLGPASFHSKPTKVGMRTAKTTKQATTGPADQAYLTPPHWSARTRQVMIPSMRMVPIQSRANVRKARDERDGAQRPAVQRANLRSVQRATSSRIGGGG